MVSLCGEEAKRGALTVLCKHRALDSGQIGSCGLDVYENEPEIHPGLLNNPKVMLLPHMGTWTVETQTEMELWTVANVRSALETGKLKSRVAEQKDMPEG
ncbi:MAG: hypothetical protein Q9207_007086 [Kuettlingeria erythrocarpa]